MYVSLCSSSACIQYELKYFARSYISRLIPLKVKWQAAMTSEFKTEKNQANYPSPPVARSISVIIGTFKILFHPDEWSKFKQSHFAESLEKWQICL